MVTWPLVKSISAPVCVCLGFLGATQMVILYIYIAYYCCLNHNESYFLRWNVWVIAVIAAISPLWSSGFTKNRTWRKRTRASCCNARSLGAAWRGGNLSWFFHGNLSPQFTVIQRWRRISTSCGHRRQPCIHNPQSTTHVAPPQWWPMSSGCCNFIKRVAF